MSQELQINMVFDFSIILTYFHKWANCVSAITGFAGAVILGFSNKLIPWGLRLPKKHRHPFKKRSTVTNGSDQATTNREEWWGNNLKNFGWFLLTVSFFIQIFSAWP
jgi:hypothetical protein